MTQSAASLIGLSPDRLLGRSLAVLSPEAVSPIRQTASRLLSGDSTRPVTGHQVFNGSRLKFFAELSSPKTIDVSLSMGGSNDSSDDQAPARACQDELSVMRLAGELSLCSELNQGLMLIRAGANRLKLGLGGGLLGASEDKFSPLLEWGDLAEGQRVPTCPRLDIWCQRTGRPHSSHPRLPGIAAIQTVQPNALMVTAPLISEGGIIGVLYAVHDSQNELPEEEERLAAFAAGISHGFGKLRALRESEAGPSGTALEESIAGQLNRSAVSGRPFTLILLNLLGYKKLKSRLGQKELTQLEAKLIGCLGDLLQADGRIIRSAPGQIAVLCEAMARDEGEGLANRLILSGSEEVDAELAAGVASASRTGISSAELLNAASLAADSASRQGGGAVVLADEL